MLRAFANTTMNSFAAITSFVDQLFTIKTKGVLALIRKMACMIAAATRMFLFRREKGEQGIYQSVNS